jgi:hypothetical protein
MREVYLGDSYDLIKRFWTENLCKVAPLYAHSRFVPQSIRKQYTKVTAVPVLESVPEKSFGLLLDPQIGIPLPTDPIGNASVSHAPLSALRKQIRCGDATFCRPCALFKGQIAV